MFARVVDRIGLLAPDLLWGRLLTRLLTCGRLSIGPGWNPHPNSSGGNRRAGYHSGHHPAPQKRAT